MSRAIDADALFIEMEKAQWYNNADRDEIAEELVQDAPTIEPRKKGRWLPLQLSMVHPPYQCSCCFRNAPMVETGCLVNRHLEALLSDFCPNCGAEMRGEQDG